MTKLTNKFLGLLLVGSGFFVTSLVTGCTVNVKHSASKTETKKETQGPSKPYKPATLPAKKQKAQNLKKLEINSDKVETNKAPENFIIEVVNIDPSSARFEIWGYKNGVDSKKNIKNHLKSIAENTAQTNVLLRELIDKFDKFWNKVLSRKQG